MKEVIFQDMGLIQYKQAWDYQKSLFQQIISRKLETRQSTSKSDPQTPNYLLFCEHPPVITLGKSGNGNNLLMNKAWLTEHGIEFYHINRGGDITFHGPGQIVGYPIINLDLFFTDMSRYLRILEEMVIRTLDEFGIIGKRIPKATGVWIDADNPKRARKICAMGIHCSRWVTMHGFALNINTELSYFNYIVPCGIHDKQVTSLENELGTKMDLKIVKQKLKAHFEQLFDVQLVTKTNVTALK